ncbi:aldo/keto reductase [Paenibacillus periandrae]|uniref:aldo/keto reductase n=1 Tax=Paenibacillus periandrae TaxID=1761741 RepID=UPI001F09B672|nr:aldo/keto reductase [Paenibacillus periandrae]
MEVDYMEGARIRRFTDCASLNNGVLMPWLGLGVYKAKEGGEIENALLEAFRLGYRSIDTAACYKNEAGVGKGIKISGIPRDEMFITTKLWNDDHGYEKTLKAFEVSREKLSVSYVDLYLIHWPGKDKYKETWRALEKLYSEGLVRAIGVSNFKKHHLEDIMSDCTIVPAVNQIELHPRLTQKNLLQYCRDKGIHVEAWSPLMRGQIFDDEVIQDLSQHYNKSPAQIILRWNLEHELITIPKTVRTERLQENMDIFDFELTPEDVSRLDGLNQDVRIGPDPDVFLF